MADNLGNTWTSEWNLVCDSEYLKNVAEMFFLVGVATGGVISGEERILNVQLNSIAPFWEFLNEFYHK